MQEKFRSSPELVKNFRDSLSDPRFRRYLDASKGDEINAILLYQWNSLLSQSLYIYLQCWEICIRNKINSFLSWKYNPSWPYDEKRAVRNLKADDKRRLKETISRQERDRRVSPVPTSAIVADLSAGFWVSQLSGAYAIPYSWRYNIARIFPSDVSIDHRTAWAICDQLLILRNRVAHHEPVFHLPLDQRHSELRKIVAAMSDATFAFADATCDFRTVWARRPDA